MAFAVTALTAREGYNVMISNTGCTAYNVLHDLKKHQDDTTAVAINPKMLDEVIVCDRKKRKTKFGGNGIKIPGGVTSWERNNIGSEVGYVIKSERLFEVSEISFSVLQNSLKGAKAGINLYIIDNGTFVNVLQNPIYIYIPISDNKQEFCIVPDERIVIGSGEYYLSLMLVDYDRTTCKESEKMLFPLYLKKSYIRNSGKDGLKKISVGLGIEAKGFEYR